MKRIAIIPARGGSKRIPKKNIRHFFGKPMIQYAISLAQKSNLFDEILVSSDDAEIIKIAESLGAKTLEVRPKHLSDDYTPTIPVIEHNIKKAEKAGWFFDFVCCIYPCVPFTKVVDLNNSFSKLLSNDFDFSFPLVKFSSPIQRALTFDNKQAVSRVYPEFELNRTQDLTDYYYDAGQFYWGRKKSWLTSKNLHSNSTGIIIPSWRSVDFDTLDDWERGEALYATAKSTNSNSIPSN